MRSVCEGEGGGRKKNSCFTEIYPFTIITIKCWYIPCSDYSRTTLIRVSYDCSSTSVRILGHYLITFMSSFFSDHDEFFRNTKQVLDEMGVQNYTSEDCKIVKYICTLVSARAAFLASAGLATLINRAQKPEMTIAVDGSLYRFHPRFHNLMTLKIQELVKPGLKVRI